MIPISQMEACTMLGIDPKTLRNWLRHTSMQFTAHPTDARLKCLTQEQVQQLATLHARPLRIAPDPSRVPHEEVSPLLLSPEPTVAVQENGRNLVSAVSSFSQEAELRKVVSGLEAKVLTLQEQLTQLSIEWLRERSERYERRLRALEALLPLHAPGPSSVQELGSAVEHPLSLTTAPPAC